MHDFVEECAIEATVHRHISPANHSEAKTGLCGAAWLLRRRVQSPPRDWSVMPTPRAPPGLGSVIRPEIMIVEPSRAGKKGVRSAALNLASCQPCSPTILGLFLSLSPFHCALIQLFVKLCDVCPPACLSSSLRESRHLPSIALPDSPWLTRLPRSQSMVCRNIPG